MIEFLTAKSIVIPEGEVAKIVRGDQVLWEKDYTIATLADFMPGFVNSSDGALGQNATYPHAIYSPLMPLEQGKTYAINSDLSINLTDSGVRIRIYKADGSYAMSVTNTSFNNAYTSMTKNTSSIYVAQEITITAKQDCKIRVMFLDSNCLTTATIKIC